MTFVSRWLFKLPLVTRRVLVLLPNEPPGFSLPSVAHAASVFENAGLEVVYASLRGGSAPADRATADASDLQQLAFWAANEQKASQQTLQLSRCPPKDFVAMFLPHSKPAVAESAEVATQLHDFARQLLKAGGVIGAVGLGLSGVAALKLDDRASFITQRQISGIAGDDQITTIWQAHLRAHGACIHHEPHQDFSTGKIVAISGRLITGAGPPAALAVAQSVTHTLSILDLI
uniref:DJ-1/PfpI domain-containing protein n=1 Tax=Calcidiscus leptoporus TaxID=127549 RepID=A0A7S0P230_9EUKA